MRLLAGCLLFFLALSLISSVNASSKWGILFNSFFENGTPGIAVQSDSPADDSIHARVKRAIFAAMGWTPNCNTGWTGQYCETPICNPAPPLTSSNTLSSQIIDRVDLGSGCAQTMTFPVASGGQRLTITISVTSGSPKITLIDNNNIVISTTGTIMPTASIFLINNPIPGSYWMNVTLDEPSTYYCRVHVEILSYLSVAGGFVETPNSDQVANTMMYANSPYYFVAHGFNVSGAGTLGAFFVRVNSEYNPSYTSRLSQRYGCNYEFYAGFYTCTPNFYDYYWTVEGTDNQGNRFRRTRQFQCLNRPTPPTTMIPSTQPPGFCRNGGTMVNANTTNQFCYCGEFYTGNDCTWPVCMNGGVQTPTGCDCQSGFTGTFCEHVTCNNDNIGNFFSEQKTLIIVIRRSPYVAARTSDIARVINDQINYYLVNDVVVYNNFILVTFGNNNITWLEYYDKDAMITDLMAISTDATSCNDTVIDAVSKVFMASAINNKSPVLVFTDVPASDGQDYLTVNFMNTFRKLPIFVYFYANPSNPCNTDTLSPNYRVLQGLAHTSGGLVFTPSNAAFINALKYSMRSVTFHRQWVLGYDFFQCQMGNHGSFFVDSQTLSIAIMATGTNLSVSVTDPLGNSVLVIDTLPGDNNNFIWNVTSVVHGAYLFFITSSGGSTMPCQYRVYIESVYDLFYGVSNSLLTDATFSEPIANQGSNMVAVLNGLRGRVEDQFRLFSEMQISRYNSSGALEPVYYSNGVYRDGCNFHLHFGAFTCNTPNEHLMLTVYADDERGYPIQRTAVAYCAYEEVTQAPPGTCLHGGVPNPYNTTACLCPTYWTGQYCEQLYCGNNGTAVNNQFCQCPPFTNGRYCERIACDNAATDVSFDFTHRSVAFVLNVQQTMAGPLQDLANNVESLVRDLFIMHSRFITQFVVVTYDQNTVELLKVSDDPLAFIASVQYAASVAANATPAANCTGLMDSAIVRAVDQSLTSSFVFVFTDSESSEDNLNYIHAMLNAQDARTQINLIATTNAVCGGVNGYQFNAHHIQMVEYTEGELFYTTHPGAFLEYIPTLYKSGLFNGMGSDNCSIQTYLPIDYWSQAFTIYVGGQNVSITVTPPSGIEADYKNLIDKDTYMTIQQYIIPCEAINNTYWRPSGQYCYNYVLNSTTWNQAYAECHTPSRGHMVHIFNQDTQTYINSRIGTYSIWLGLTRVGNSTNFVWDNPQGAPPITLSGYTNWEPTQNQNDTSTGNCVILKPGSDGQPRWWTQDCTTTSTTTMCQKHRYNQDFIPGQDVNLLPAGLWMLSITGSGPCGYAARIQSDIQIFYKFTSDFHSDQGRTYADLGIKDNRFIATATGLSPLNFNGNEDGIDGKLNYAYLYSNSTLIRAATFQERSLCSYKSVSQTFACPQFGSSSTLTQMPVMFTGIDQFGNLFERIGTPYCSVQIAACQHEGVLLNGRCICPPNFEGEQCENRICFNGGTRMPNGECFCTEETGGESCQFFQCVPPRKADFSDNGKTLAILIETSYAMTTPIYRLRKNIQAIIQNITATANAPNWFTNYILYPFDSSVNEQYWYNKTYSPNIADIATAMASFTPYDCPNSQCVSGDQCPRPLLRIINDTLNDPMFVAPNSVILLFTQSTVEDISRYESVFNRIQATRAQIQVIIPDITSPCSLPWTDASNRMLFALPQMSGGDLFTVYSYDMVSSLLPLYLPSLYRNAVVDSLVVRNCSRDEILISIDSYTPEITIVYSGVNPQLTLVDSQNISVVLPPNAINSIFNYLGVVTTYGRGGIYKLIATSDSAQGSCLINVHANSQVEITAGFVYPNDAYNGATDDDAHWVAVADPNQSNVVVLHTTNNDGYAGISYVQLYRTSGFGRGQIFTSEVFPRSFNCSYQWYSARGFRCNPYDTYELAVYGVDTRGFGFRRSLPVHCIPTGALPQRPPTPPTCDVSTRYYDIVLILDGSRSSNFSVLQNLMITAFSGYSLNANNTRLSVIVVNAGASVQGYLKDSDGKVSAQVISPTTTDNSAGQALQAALNLTINENLNPTSSGYRSDARHLIVYATSNAQYTGGDPVDTLLSIRRSGMFGFISVGYNLDTVGINSLASLTGPDCTYSDNTQNAPVNIANFIQDITCYRRPVCGEA